MRKIIIITFVIFTNLFVVLAQNKEIEQTVRMDTIQIDYKTHYTSSFWDNFYIEADFAGRMLMGEEDNQLSFGKRIKPGFSLTLGKWIHPDYGIRLNIGGARLKGWNSGPTGIYNYADTWITGGDPVQAYWEGQGVATTNGYRQDIKYYELNADFLIDFYNMFTTSNRLNRCWSTQGYIGVGMLRAAHYHGMESNVKMGFRIGLIGNYNLTSRLGAHITVGGTITDSGFDGELGKGRKFTGILSGAIGLSYRIGRQGFKAVRLVPQDQLNALNNAITLIRKEETLPGKTVEVTKKVAGNLLAPSVVFYPGKNKFNEELQMVNVYHIARYMQNNNKVKIVVIGNTDGTGTRLARRRAEQVRDLLVNKYGISSEHLEIQTYDVNAQYSVTGYEQSVNFSIAR